jgi:hypothetical protein
MRLHWPKDVRRAFGRVVTSLTTAAPRVVQANRKVGIPTNR